MTDKELIRKRFSSTFKQYDLLAHTQQEICRRLAAMTEGWPAPAAALEVGTGTGFLTRLLLTRYPDTHWTLNDIADASEEYLRPITEGAAHRFLWGDAESLDFPGGLDLIASASTVQWFDDLPGFLNKCSAATRTDGLLALSTFGPGNFEQIKTLTGQGLHYYTLPETEAMVRRAGYEILQSEQYVSRLHFASGADVLRHIKATGVNSLDKTRWTRGRLADFQTRYATLYPAPDGGVTLTYHPVLITACKRGAAAL